GSVALSAGVVPVESARFSMAVVVSEPGPGRRGYYGGSVSGPVFHDVMQGALRLMDVPPDDIESWLAVQRKGAGLGTRDPGLGEKPAGAVSDALRVPSPESRIPTGAPQLAAPCDWRNCGRRSWRCTATWPSPA